MRDSTALLHSPFVQGTRLSGFDAARLLPPVQAVLLYLGSAHLRPPDVESVALDAAAGRVLAADTVAREDHPSHARSTMDGFALASASRATRRRIAGSVALGKPAAAALAVDEALRVPTGGALPVGADAVVPQEDVAIEGDTIVLHAAIAAGDSVSARASDIAAGDVVLSAGRRIGAPELGVLATLGFAHVPVFRRPRIGIISTGDELIDPETTPLAGQIRDSNRYAIAGALLTLGAEPIQLPRVADDAVALRAALDAGLARCDAVITTGGSSVGERDLMPQIVGQLGAPGTLVHGLRVKPGKPTLLAAVDGKAVIGLPGNPASSLMILEAVVRPIIAALLGERDARPTMLEAIAAAPFTGRPGWTHFVPARLSLRGAQLVAEPLLIRSAQTSLLARASGYATIGETPDRIEAGERIGVTLFTTGGAPIVAA